MWVEWCNTCYVYSVCVQFNQVSVLFIQIDMLQKAAESHTYYILYSVRQITNTSGNIRYNIPRSTLTCPKREKIYIKRKKRGKNITLIIIIINFAKSWRSTTMKVTILWMLEWSFLLLSLKKKKLSFSCWKDDILYIYT